MFTYNLYFMVKLEEDSLFSRTEKLYSKRKYPLHIKSHERKSVESLVNNLFPFCPTPSYYDGFCFSYTIPQIGKEFDLLKITTDSVLNIELKSVDPGKKVIREQLLKNRYYLGHLKKKLFLYTYVMRQNLYYTLNSEGALISVSVKDLADALVAHHQDYEKELDSLFEVCDYLISPVGDPKEFLNGSYFLTQQQQVTKRKILSSLERKPSFIALSGIAGTGKTLLIYDLIKELHGSHRCLLLHPGFLTDGHRYLDEKMDHFEIASILPESSLPDLSRYEFIFSDEAHRLPLSVFEQLKEAVLKNHSTCFFAYDRGQYLTVEEQKASIPSRIESLPYVERYRLSGAIRSNRPLLQFQEALFDKNALSVPFSGDHIQICYTDDAHLEAASEYYCQSGYTKIDCRVRQKLPSTYNVTAGAEYSKVVLILNDDFYYTKQGKLVSKKCAYSLLPLNYLKAALSRAREEVALLITSKKLFSDLLELFEK